jgi:hypothetical protein
MKDALSRPAIHPFPEEVMNNPPIPYLQCSPFSPFKRTFILYMDGKLICEFLPTSLSLTKEMSFSLHSQLLVVIGPMTLRGKRTSLSQNLETLSVRSVSLGAQPETRILAQVVY